MSSRGLRVVDWSEPKKETPWGAKPVKESVRMFGNIKDVCNSELNNWFYDIHEDDWSPYRTTTRIAELFHEFLGRRGFKLSMTYKEFHKSLCDAVCSYVYNGDLESGAPQNVPPPPKGWNEQMTEIWYDYILFFCLPPEFWENFWHNIDIGLWELQFPYIRNYLQSILHYYVYQDMEILIQEELIVVNNEGHYIDPLEAEIEMEEERRRNAGKWE